MVKDSLGLLEVAGLLGAITAPDAMVKAANVRLIGERSWMDDRKGCRRCSRC